ncbi:ribosome recycling factor [Holotrichia oblita]|uniref:Ribosome recycling factor n=1 Tax=Holotrichia oblita TaxID=644536 RepID=A0ACB9T3P6_HOLOL|nr:ribosome recycling factor [Holotrichia oblita]
MAEIVPKLRDGICSITLRIIMERLMLCDLGKAVTAISADFGMHPLSVPELYGVSSLYTYTSSSGAVPEALAVKCLNRNIISQVPKNQTIFVINYARTTDLLVNTTHQTCMQLTAVRGYAKSKDKKKDKGKAKVQINENQLGELVNLDTLRTHFQKPIETLKEEFIKNLSLRTAAGSIENLTVNLDGKDYILQELGQIVRKNPTMTIVNMSVFPQAIPAAIKAIQKSGMNLNPQQDGTTLYIPVPKITTEHREHLAKNAKQLFIKCRDIIKDTQMKHIKILKKKVSVSEDIIKQTEQQIVALADTYITEAQTIYNSKCNELLNK